MCIVVEKRSLQRLLNSTGVMFWICVAAEADTNIYQQLRDMQFARAASIMILTSLIQHIIFLWEHSKYCNDINF